MLFGVARDIVVILLPVPPLPNLSLQAIIRDADPTTAAHVGACDEQQVCGNGYSRFRRQVTIDCSGDLNGVIPVAKGPFDETVLCNPRVPKHAKFISSCMSGRRSQMTCTTSARGSLEISQKG